MKRILSVLVSFALILSILPLNVFAAGDSANAKQYSGEELLKGIIFGVGDAAKDMGVWTDEEFEINNSKEVIEQVDLLVGEIGQLDATFFDRFEENIYSSNYVKLEKNFTELNSLLDKAIENLVDRSELGIDTTTASKDGIGLNAVAAVGWLVYAGAAVTTGAAVTHVVVATAGGAAAAYLVIYGEKYFWGPDSVNDKTTQLVKEQFIDKIITTFN
ncbi:sporulation delaying protein family toxin [Ornithinibacillus halotolerans]|uniref:Sporulation delaying protein family toxin n=1 Tax=Ornithinibacillus halotolerans TaxID=1274357 RepID=A0A916WEK9_9BACI|nr:sporulation delaying protein family toxin [Ornithinibacillus halotolerans]GGA91159.1 hypothetical protein GCM10008025_37100 [Ornithinibacillus halotolerans]